MALGLLPFGTTVVSIPLSVPNPGETEYAVTLARSDLVLDRAEWRPLFRKP